MLLTVTRHLSCTNSKCTISQRMNKLGNTTNDFVESNLIYVAAKTVKIRTGDSGDNLNLHG